VFVIVGVVEMTLLGALAPLVFPTDMPTITFTSRSSPSRDGGNLLLLVDGSEGLLSRPRLFATIDPVSATPDVVQIQVQVQIEVQIATPVSDRDSGTVLRVTKDLVLLIRNYHLNTMLIIIIAITIILSVVLITTIVIVINRDSVSGMVPAHVVVWGIIHATVGGLSDL
jgi:hypothetical protein